MENLREASLNSQYNNEPVHFCKSCLSLHIEVLGNPESEECNDAYCVKCNRTEIATTNIFAYRELFRGKYGVYPEDINNH